MDITVRLYKLHDFDLIYLYKNLRFPIRDAMKKALISYVRNEPVFFDFPIEIPESDKLIDIKSSQFHIKLDENTDKDIILYLSGLKRFYRNSFLKNLLRGYLTGPAAFVYESEINLNKSKDRAEKIKNNMLGIETLKKLKPRKQRKNYVVLTKEQKELFDQTGALNDTDIIIKK